MSAEALRVTDLTAGYRSGRRSTPVLQVASLTARHGELTVVVGPNGGGKSTLLRTCTGTLAPLAGEVTIAGEPLQQIDRRRRAQLLAVVFTDRPDAGLLSVGEVIALGRQPYTSWSGALAAADVRAARRAAELVGIDDRWGQRFDELSDGLRQRALIARALAQEPSVLVLDEPTAFLDLPGRVEVTALLTELAGDVDLAVIVSTHDLELVLGHADHAWVVAAGTVGEGAPAALVRDGTFAAAFPAVAFAVDPSDGTITARGQIPHRVRTPATCRDS